ncbi:acyl-CoA dehydrogenase family protein [Acidiferrimicrobium sp. IK]|uniref:acyl-CoA dehydrogenase family protein n=1 Tax=Acidiferrimicrobium sp. IK TaxID=2871700 RepID=UPI0021CB3E8B|nr:acyl-CoA dehydrogenase family protein [Acidiferrimicrobium sp. IK]MCU4182894.1 acyl-CoA dehydrogenase family protein [Acidiferrimicrobium sp. IK]
MLLEPLPDQESLRDTTAKYLADVMSSEQVRRLRDDAAGFAPGYWRQGAELGWTSLLVGEAQGGGSVSEHGLVDLTLIAHEFGLRAAPGPLLPANIVAGALSAEGAGDHSEVVAGLLSGASVASWAYAEEAVAATEPAAMACQVRAEGDELVIDGVKRPVEAAAQSDHLLVTGRTGDGLTQVLVAAGTPGLSVEAMHSVDLTRRFARVELRGVRVPSSAAVGSVGGAGAQVERQFEQAVVLACAEAVGAMQAAFDMTLAWTFDRYSFGRPLASYQALKHRCADMKSWLEGAHAVTDAAARALATAAPDAAELASVAKSFVGDYGAELLQDCVQMHGGVGVTFDHDLHLYLRRVSLQRALWGTPAEHKRRITTLLEQRGDA